MLAISLVVALLPGMAGLVWADELDAAVAAARGGALPILAEAESLAGRSAAAQASAERPGHADLGSLMGLCDEAGEVVGAGPDVAAIFDAFRDSARHWSIITAPQWTAMGSGQARSAAGALYVSVVFCKQSVSGAPTTVTTEVLPPPTSPATTVPPTPTPTAATTIPAPSSPPPNPTTTAAPEPDPWDELLLEIVGPCSTWLMRLPYIS